MSGFPAPPDLRDDWRWTKWIADLARKFWTIPEYTSDPGTPNPGDVWVLFSGGTYQLSFRTKAGTTKRVTLT